MGEAQDDSQQPERQDESVDKTALHRIQDLALELVQDPKSVPVTAGNTASQSLQRLVRSGAISAEQVVGRYLEKPKDFGRVKVRINAYLIGEAATTLEDDEMICSVALHVFSNEDSYEDSIFGTNPLNTSVYIVVNKADEHPPILLHSSHMGSDEKDRFVSAMREIGLGPLLLDANGNLKGNSHSDDDLIEVEQIDALEAFLRSNFMDQAA